MTAAGVRLKSIAGGAIGNLVEWYDWYAYSFLSLYFAPLFFPEDDPLAQQLSTAAIFAVGFLVRPLGGLWLGWWADKYGRKSGLLVSILMMCGGSLIIALTPSADRIGLAAPVLLLVARLLQGLSVGGEFGASAAYLSEIATSRHRGFWSSFQYVTLVGGQLIALAVLLLLQALMTPAALADWGWRLPFALGAAFAVVGLFIRRGMAESAAFDAVPAARHEKLLATLGRHPRAIMIVIGITAGSTLSFYALTTYMQKFLVNSAGFTKDATTQLLAVALTAYALAQPLFGWLSDRIGRLPMLLAYGVLGMLFSVPLFQAIGEARSTAAALLPLLAALAILSLASAITPLVKAGLFPAEVRALGVATGHSVGVALFGGTAEFVAGLFKRHHHEAGFFWYVAGMCGLTLVATVIARRDISRSTLD